MSHELELQELIREVARAKSTFLRVSPRDVKRILYERRPRVESSSTFLSSVERHLLDVYREELARTLNMLCLQKLYSPGRRIPHSRCVALHEEVQVPSADATRRLARETLRATPTLDPWTDEALDLLKQCVTDKEGTQLSVSQLAAASHRVAPSDHAQIYIALDLWELGRNEEALAALERLVTCSSSSLATSAAFENIGCVFFSAGRFQEGMVAYQRAIKAYDIRLNSLVGLFALFVQLGREEAAVFTARRIDELVTHQESVIASVIKTVKQCRERDVWRATKESQITIDRIEDRVGLAARSVLSVFKD